MLQLVMCRISSPCVGLLVDWLELLCPEIVGSSPASLQSQLSLLFGRRRSPDVGRVTTRRSPPRNGSYLLDLLAHQSSWANVRATLVLLLESRTCIDKYDASIVLNFLLACVRLPRLWQGRDRKLPKVFCSYVFLMKTGSETLCVI